MQVTTKSSRRGPVVTLTLALLLALLSACGSAVPAPIPTGSAPELLPGATPFIVDTDMSLDDWIAILYLLQRPDVDVKAIIIAGTGIAHCEPGTRNAQNLAALAGRPEIPVACGRDAPLAGSRAFPEAWRSGADGLYGVSLLDNPNPPSDQPAVELMSDVLQNSDAPVRILALGPLTNLGEMLQADSALLAQIETVVIMGGALNVPGNMLEGEAAQNPIAEWNIYVDPYAAQIVLAPGFQLLWSPSTRRMMYL